MSLEIQPDFVKFIANNHLRTNNKLFLQVECFLKLFFCEIMFESFGYSLYTSAAYTQVFTVIQNALIRSFFGGQRKFDSKQDKNG